MEHYLTHVFIYFFSLYALHTISLRCPPKLQQNL